MAQSLSNKTYAVGFSADRGGRGVAYVQSVTGEKRIRRVLFRSPMRPGTSETDIAYAALSAVVEALARSHKSADHGSIVLWTNADDLITHRLQKSPPANFVLPYIRLGCALNRLGNATMAAPAMPSIVSDLEARAYGESHIAEAA